MAANHQQNLLSLLRLHQDYNDDAAIVAHYKVTPEIPALKRALGKGTRIYQIIDGASKRANTLLGLALETSGLGHLSDHWYLTLHQDPQRLSDEAQFQQRVSFILHVKSKPWKGNIKTCPLYKIMPLSFPVAWLDQPISRTRKEMRALLQK